MSRHDLLIEIGCEELPARLVQALAEALAEGVCAGLAERDLEHGAANCYATPRRVAVLIADVPTEQPEQRTERRGPAVAAAFRDGQATKAAQGFARSCGVSVNELSRVETDKGEYLHFSSVQPGATTASLLQPIFDGALSRMDRLVPKRMRWGAGDAVFIRPVHWLVCLFGADAPPLTAFGLRSDRRTRGHRFHAPDELVLNSPADYLPQLHSAYVMADTAQRRDRIARDIEQISGGRARVPADLLDEVTALVEWPVAVLGNFDQRYLELPPEVIVTTVQEHQRYFTVFDADGKITREFVTISNIESREPQVVRAGNEKVVRPRLEDAYFFWQQDRSASFDQWQAKLTDVTYIRGLGSIAAKAERMAALAASLATEFGQDPASASRAAGLAKCDLASQMVYEFPELQGVMGGYYAQAFGETDEIAAAIAEHYRPEGPGSAIPGSSLAQLVSFVDKLDTLCCLFAHELRPTSSKDPFGARRAALGMIRIGAETGLKLDLNAAVAAGLAQQTRPAADTAEALGNYLRERLRGTLLDQNLPARVVDAVLARGGLDAADSLARARALQAFQNSPAAEQLGAANKRIRNILEGDQPELASAHRSCLRETSEQALLAAIDGLGSPLGAALAGRDYAAALEALTTLAQPIDDLFAQVMVNAEDAEIRAARRALLHAFQQQCNTVADFGVLAEGAS